MSNKLPVNNFEWIKDTWINENFIENYNEESDEEYFVEVDVHFLEKLHDLYNYLQILLERIKFENVEKLLANLHDKTDYLIHIRNLKQELNHG